MRQMGSTSSYDELWSLFGSASELPQPPRAPLKLAMLLEAPEANPGEIESVILSDPALTATTIKAASSAIFGRSRPVTTVKEAVMVLGFRSLRSLAVALWSSALVSENKHASMLDSNRFSRHGFAVGIYSGRFFEEVKDQGQWTVDEIFAAGVLQSISSGLLALVSPHDFDEIYSVAYANKASVPDIFYETYGHSLGELGGRAARVLGLPAIYCTVIEQIDLPDDEHRDDVGLAVIHSARGWSIEGGNGIGPWTAPYNPPEWVQAKFDPENIEEILDDAETRLKSFSAILS